MKINKTLDQKKVFSVFGGVPFMPLRLFPKKHLIIFFSHEKVLMYHFKICFTKNCSYCSMMFLVTVKH